MLLKHIKEMGKVTTSSFIVQWLGGIVGLMDRIKTFGLMGVLVAVSLLGAVGVPGLGSVSPANASGTPIKVGVITDNQTPCQEAGQLNTVQNAIKAWASNLNAHGGVKGHRVQLTILNTDCSPSVTVSDANKLVADHVAAIIDNSNTNSNYASVVDAAKIPVICGPSTGNGLYCSTDANYFPTGQTEIPGAYTLAVAAKKAGAHTYGFLYCTEVATCSEAIGFIGNEVASVGLKYAHVAASETAPSYAAQCLVMKNDGVDALFVGGPPSLKVASDCAQQGYHPTYMEAVGTWEAQYLKSSYLNGAQGASSDVPWNLDASPAEKTFHTVEGRLLNASGFPYEVQSSYAAGLLLQTALEKAPANPTNQDVTSALYSLSGTTLGGFTPPLNYTPGKATTVSCGFIVGIKNGKWVAPNGSKTVCTPS